MSSTAHVVDTTVRLCFVIAEVLDDMDPGQVQLAHQLESHLGLDSFGRVELLNSLEDEFSISFRHPQDRELTRPQTTVADLVAAVQLQLGAA